MAKNYQEDKNKDYAFVELFIIGIIEYFYLMIFLVV